MADSKIEISERLLVRRDQLKQFFKITNRNQDWETKYRNAIAAGQLKLKQCQEKEGCDILEAAMMVAELHEKDAKKDIESIELERRLAKNIAIVAAVELLTLNDYTDAA